MEAARLERLLLDLRRRHPDLEWSTEPDDMGSGSTTYLWRSQRPKEGPIVEVYPGVPSARVHVGRASLLSRPFVFEAVADAELADFLDAVLSDRMRRLPPHGLMQRVLRVKTLRVVGSDKAWTTTH
jgi:hypothetical protein